MCVCKNNISCNPDKELQPLPEDEQDCMCYPEDVPTTGEIQQPTEDVHYLETDETIGEQAQQSVQTSCDSHYPNTDTVREATYPEEGTLDFNLFHKSLILYININLLHLLK